MIRPGVDGTPSELLSMNAYDFVSHVEGLSPVRLELPFTRSRFSEYDTRIGGQRYYEFRHRDLPDDYEPPRISDEIWERAKREYQNRKTLVYELEDGIAKVSYYLARMVDDSDWAYSAYAKLV
jgi:hypothetical protein